MKRGHWCWCCQSRLPNERFSGPGHRRHLCKACSSLTREERDYRQAVLDINRILDRAGTFRKKRSRLVPFLNHPDERIQRFVEDLLKPRVREVEPESSDLDEISEHGPEPRHLPLLHDDEEIPF